MLILRQKMHAKPDKSDELMAALAEIIAPALDWLNKGVFISVGGRQPGAVIYETYLVG